MGSHRSSRIRPARGSPDRGTPDNPPDAVTDVTPDGKTLIYTEAPTGRIGFVDIRREEAPEPDGILDVGGDPTSVGR